VPCELSQNQLHGYLDAELGASGAMIFETHLESCADCKRVLAAEAVLRASLQEAALYERAPHSLRDSVYRLAAGQIPSTSPSRNLFFRWHWLAAAVALALLAFLGWREFDRAPQPSSTGLMASALVDAHLRSLQPGHLTDVESTDQHTVKPWFDGRLDFSPPVHDFAGDGFPLLGGRLDIVQGRTVAALVYGRRKHLINVFVARAFPGAARDGAGSQQGYQWLAWQKDGFWFCAVSDVSSPELLQLQRFIQGQ